VNTLEVPADIYDEALAFCNERLREQGKPEITELPAGWSGQPRSCPCGRACNVWVGLTSWSPNEYRWEKSEGHPTRFVDYFDGHVPKGIETLPIRKEAP